MTTTEQHAADHVLAGFHAAETMSERRSLYEAYLLLANRGLRGGPRFLPVENDTEDFRRSPRKSRCGRYTLHGKSLDGTHSRFLRLDCKCWDCLRCGPRKASRYRHAIARAAEANKLSRFLTLTLDPKKTPRRGAVQHIKASWARLRAQIRKVYGRSPKFICVMEFQEKTGMPHLHIVFDQYIPQAWLKNAWTHAGGGEHVDIRAVDLHRAARYLSKYLTKDLLCSAPKRSRRVTVSRGITLNEKSEKTHRWELLHCTIFNVFRSLSSRASEVKHDTEMILQSFDLPLSPVLVT